ncbi:hypothetical protein [Roseomonas sp. WA12]
MKPLRTVLLFASVAVVAMILAASPSSPQPTPTLQSAESFFDIPDPAQRSVALFGEAMKVIAHPRCLNCHPVNRVPTQGDDLRAHVPPIDAQASGQGPAGLSCHACHQSQNVSTHADSLASIPGHPHWHLAPAEMAWQGRTAAAICAQIKDPARNGNRTLASLREHMADDTLVGWAWNPGRGRTPAPGTQAVFGGLIEAWIATGAACPGE